MRAVLEHLGFHGLGHESRVITSVKSDGREQ